MDRNVTRLAIAAVATSIAVVGLVSPVRAASPLPPLPLPPINLVPPSIAGSAAAGATVTCAAGQWLNNPTSYSYSWQRDLVTTISGPGAADTYTLTSSDVDQPITCSVTATNGFGSGSAVSLPVIPVTAPIAGVPIDESLPAISGNPETGQTVTCSPGAWLNNPAAYAYSWQRDAASIPGQTGNTYMLAAADVNQVITCEVVASNSSGSGVPAVSLPVVPSGQSSGSGSSGGGVGSGVAASRAAAAPRLLSFSVSPSKMVVSVHRSRRSTKGVTFGFTLDRAASLWIIVERKVSGRIVGRRCVALGHRARRRARSCTRYAVVKTLSVPTAVAGKNRLRYVGRAGSRLLAMGGYRAIAAALASGVWSPRRSVKFAVVARRR